MKVLHLTAGNLYGGIETYLLTLARLRNLCPEMEPHFALCFPGRLRDELTAAKVPVHDMGPVRVSRPWTVLRARRRLKRVLREHGFTAAVTHGTWPHAVFAPVVKRAGVRLVNAVHDYLDRRHWINRWAARTPPDLAIANSRYTAPSAAALFPGVPVEPIYLPVPAPVVDPSARCEVRAELGAEQETVVILQASRLERWKGQAIHLAALVELAKMPGWIAWIAGGAQKAGETEYLEELQLTVKSAGIGTRVMFLGQRADVSRLMAAADIYCQPNTGPEPFGIAFVEALHAGLPVVTSDLGGAKEIVCSGCGLLCPPGDTFAVASALRELIAKPERRRELSKAGPARAAELCEPGRQMRSVSRLLAGKVL